MNTKYFRSITCPSIFHAGWSTVTLSKKWVEHPPTPFTYLWAHATATTRGNNQTQKHLILLILNTAILMLCVFFLLVKTDEVQLILASAVIPMPGACVFPTTTSRSSAAAAATAGSGRCSTQPRWIFKGEPGIQVTQGHTGVSLCLFPFFFSLVHNV